MLRFTLVVLVVSPLASENVPILMWRSKKLDASGIPQ